MSEREPLHLFEGFGVELEYMIVDRRTLNVRPIADVLLAEAADDPTLEVTEAEREEEGGVPSEIAIAAIDEVRTSNPISWSNELVAHVIELKTSAPAQGLTAGLAADFQRHVRAINARLARHNAVLMGGPMHPWMDPFTEKKLWPHGFHEFYEAFDRVFDCRGHGWANLQSMHINLPFCGDAEFAGLHAAIRVLLPIMPALAAGSPFMDGRATGVSDNRLAVYKTNARKVPSVSGRVIPEPVFTKEAYEREILETIYRDIRPHDPEGLLQHEWLNARGAIARFDRNAIEIRVLDVQEEPMADLAIAALVVETLRRLSAETAAPTGLRRWGVEPLAAILDGCIGRGADARINDAAYLSALGLAELGPGVHAGRVWSELFDRVRERIDPALRPRVERLLGSGTLSERLERAAGIDAGGGSDSPPREVSRDRLRAICEAMVRALDQGSPLGAAGQ